MFDSKCLIAGILATATVGLAHGATISTVGTTGVFDEASTANAIDNDPTGNLAAFTAAVGTAYANNLGGVIDWEAGVNANASNTSPGDSINNAVDVAYGVSATQTLTITFNQQIGLYSNNVAGQVNVLSSDPLATHGDNAIIPFSVNSVAYEMAFSGADVAEVGFGMLARSTFGTGANFRATATFSDTSTSTINYNVDDGDSDTFIHFAATGGETISSVLVTWVDDDGQSLANGQRRPVMDDFGFVVVPEPSSLALLGLGGLLIARRRRG